jgi:hypothetical protein
MSISAKGIEMIVSLNRYFCFWLTSERDSDNNATLFLREVLNHLKVMEQKGICNIGIRGIEKNYTPQKIEQKHPGFKWLQARLNEIKQNDKKFDYTPSKKQDIKIVDRAVFPAFLWILEPDQDTALESIFQVLIGMDIVLFRFRFSLNVSSDSFSSTLKQLEKNDFAFSVKSEGELFAAKFKQITAEEDELKKVNLNNKDLRPVKYKSYDIKYEINPVCPDEGRQYEGMMICNYFKDSNNSIDELKLHKESGNFLNSMMCLMLINGGKISFEYNDAYFAFPEIKEKLLKMGDDVGNIKKEIERIFSPSLSHQDFLRLQQYQLEINRKLSQFNELINTCLVNKNQFRDLADTFFYEDNIWVKNCEIKLGRLIDRLRTLQMRLSYHAASIRDSIELLMEIGTIEISLNYASELITFNGKIDKNGGFHPMLEPDSPEGYIDPGNFTIFRPIRIHNAKFESLSRHYLEALYQNPKNILKMIIDTILSPQRELELRFSNPSTNIILGKINIGKLLGGKNGTINVQDILKAMHCYHIGNNNGNNKQKCQFTQISTEEIDPLDAEADRYQYWVGVNSMISFFEALCTLYDSPRHHVSLLREKAKRNNRDETYQELKKRLLFITGLLCLKVNYCEKARKYLGEAILLAHKENTFDWAFSVAQIASLCESCTHSANKNEEKKEKGDKDGHAEVKEDNHTTKDKSSGKDNSFRTRLASYFLEVLDLPKAIAITRSPGKSKIKLHKYNNTIRIWLLTVVILVVSGLLLSSYFIYKNGNKNIDNITVSLVCTITWIIALIGAPISLMGGAWRKRAGKLFPQLLYPKYLSVITLTVITFSFSGKLIVSVASQIRISIIIVLGIISIVIPALYLGGKFKTIIKDKKERRRRIFDFLCITFLEACTLSAFCMFLYGPTFENKDPKFIHHLFQSDVFYFFPIFMILASLVAVLLGIVYKDMLNPVGTDAD